MKKLFLLIITSFISIGSYAQSFTIGPRVGVSQSYLKVNETIQSVKYETGKAMVGFHGGVFARAKFSSLYVQPELLFTSAGGQIDLNDPSKDDIKVRYNRVDVPVLVGLKASALRINIGPVATFFINPDKNLSEELKGKYNSATFGFQGGIGLDISKLVIDLKYETGLGSMTDKVTLDDGTTLKFDQRAKQIILSVGYKLL